MALEYGRLMLYVIGSTFSMLTAGRLFVVRKRLARLFALVMAVWSLNCALLFSLLIYYLITGVTRPDWSNAFFLVNALLLATAPTLLYVFFPGADDDD